MSKDLQGMMWFHATNTDLKDPSRFDLSRAGENTGSLGFLGKGLYLTNSKMDALRYGDNLLTVKIKTGNILSMNQTYSDIAKQLPGLMMKDGTSWNDAFKAKNEIRDNIKEIDASSSGLWFDVYFNYKDKEYAVHRRTASEVEGDGALKLAVNKVMSELELTDPNNIGAIGNYFDPDLITKEAIKQGYDGILSDGTNFGDVGQEVVIFDPLNTALYDKSATFDDLSEPAL